jgi:hypothetical protein
MSTQLGRDHALCLPMGREDPVHRHFPAPNAIRRNAFISRRSLKLYLLAFYCRRSSTRGRGRTRRQCHDHLHFWCALPDHLQGLVDLWLSPGTTGLPKGVLSTQRQFLTNVLNVGSYFGARCYTFSRVHRSLWAALGQHCGEGRRFPGP